MKDGNPGRPDDGPPEAGPEHCHDPRPHCRRLHLMQRRPYRCQCLRSEYVGVILTFLKGTLA